LRALTSDPRLDAIAVPLPPGLEAGARNAGSGCSNAERLTAAVRSTFPWRTRRRATFAGLSGRAHRPIGESSLGSTATARLVGTGTPAMPRGCGSAAKLDRVDRDLQQEHRSVTGPPSSSSISSTGVWTARTRRLLPPSWSIRLSPRAGLEPRRSRRPRPGLALTSIANGKSRSRLPESSGTEPTCPRWTVSQLRNRTSPGRDFPDSASQGIRSLENLAHPGSHVARDRSRDLARGY
jgi:hypothetical protein